MALQHSAKTLEIPAEIWMHVAQFVPHADLCSMVGINRIFFELSMDARYREFRFGFDSDVEASPQRLRRIRDPSIAHRVRHLYIDLYYNDPFFDGEGNYSPGWTSVSLGEATQVMAETVKFLTNITELSVEWIYDKPNEHVFPFLMKAWKTFGSGLRKLSLAVSLEYLEALLSTASGLVSLTDLDVKVGGKKFVKTHDGALSTALAPFINKIAPTLHSLSYSSSLHHLDPTPFFRRLEKIPGLERLRIVVDYWDVLEDPLSTTRFICSHATTLRCLDWDEQYKPPAEQHIMERLSRNDLKELFLNLCALRIRVPATPGGFTMVVEYVRYSAETLNSLEFLGYDMTYEEVNTLISIFALHSGRNVKDLGLPVASLSPEIILLLAQTLPHLEKLTIITQHVTGHEAGPKTASEAIHAENTNGRRLANSFAANSVNARIFADTVRTYDIRNWTLRDIDIKVDTLDIYLPNKLMWVLAECVPSIRTFRGYNKDSEFNEVELNDRL